MWDVLTSGTELRLLSGVDRYGLIRHELLLHRSSRRRPPRHGLPVRLPIRSRLCLPVIRHTRLSVDHKPQHQGGQDEREPTGTGDTERHNAENQRTNAIPIPHAIDQILEENPVTVFIRQQKPRQTVERGTRTEEQCGDQHQCAHQRDIPTETLRQSVTHAADPTVTPAHNPTGTDPGKEAAAARRTGLTIRRLLVIRLFGGVDRFRFRPTAAIQRIIMCFIHASITPIRMRSAYQGTP